VVLVSGIGGGAPFSLWEVLLGQLTVTPAVEFALAARE